jgi:outer membrane protein assembly factor BamB
VSAWFGGIVAALFAIAALPVAAPSAPPKGDASDQEWPQWRGPRRDGTSRENIADRWPGNGPRRVWRMPAGVGFASPVAYKGNVYMFSLDGGKEGLACHNADTGKTLWAQAYDVGPQRVDYEGVRATPAIDADRIYTYGSRGLLVCRSLEGGKELWRLDVLRETRAQILGEGQVWGQASSPLIVGDLLYVQGGRGPHAAVAVDKTSGRVAWKSEARGPGGYAAPVLVETHDGGKQLILFAGQALYGADPATGKTLWSEPWKTSYDINAATPVSDGRHLFVSSGYGHGCMMLELSAKGARKLWEKREVMAKFPSPVLDAGFLYAVSDESRGVIKCMKWPEGRIVWEARQPKLGPGGSIVRVDGDKLLAMSEDGALGLLLATPQGSQLISQVQLFQPGRGAKVWSSPIVYKGKVYAKGDRELVCLDVSGK